MRCIDGRYHITDKRGEAEIDIQVRNTMWAVDMLVRRRLLTYEIYLDQNNNRNSVNDN